MELVNRKIRDVILVGLAQPDTLEANNVGAFRESMANLLETNSRVLMDMSNITFLDSSGLGALVAMWRRLSSTDGEIKLCRISPSVRTVFEITRIHRVFEIYDDEEEALASFAGALEN